MNQQQQNHHLKMDSNLYISHWGVWGWGLNAFYWCQIFALDSVVVKHKNIFLADLSRRLMGELIVYQSLRQSVRRPSVNIFKHLLL